MKVKISIVIIIAVLSPISLAAQNYFLNFSGTGLTTFVDSVQVENIFTGERISLNGTDILHLIGLSGITLLSQDDNRLNVFPNPIVESGSFQIEINQSDKLNVRIINEIGNEIISSKYYLEEGTYNFEIRNLKAGFYVLIVECKAFTRSAKLISNSEYSGNPVILQKNADFETDRNISVRSQKSTIDMNYSDGERLLFRAFSNGHKRIITTIPTSDSAIEFNFVLCQDADNNNYAVVDIGEQTWTAENLKTTRYNDGSDIPYCNDHEVWFAQTTPAWRWFNDSEYITDSVESVEYFGLAYHGSTVDTFLNGNKNICPAGWHVPGSGEWLELRSYLATNGFNYDGTFTDTYPSKVGKSLASASGWDLSAYEGTVGSIDFPEYRNKTGFSAIPGPDTQNSYWWSSTLYGDGINFGFDMNYANVWLDEYYFYQNWDIFSIRCIKD